MGPLGADDLTSLLAEFGEEVTCGLDCTMGVLDQADALEQDTSGSPYLVPRTVLTIATGTLPSLVDGAALMIGGDEYHARDVRRVEDGQATQVWVTRG